ncbi:D-serine deaminase [Klebsiella michiganensis]|uniref:D-serine deaminase n=1 Tax=Klebsiella michiganensis TaxID=1134687 RepID=A0A7H4N8F3_9ENTR|nr:D-serine deaminase [Klebsiella michiganensis]
MQRYADARGVSLAPHGKTTMTPWIFQAQQRAGRMGNRRGQRLAGQRGDGQRR